MPATDAAYLTARGFSWETLIEGTTRWLMIHALPVPEGYNLRSASAAIPIDPGYPDRPLDMVYFSPALARLDGKPIGGLAPHSLDGKEWQRWSRHRTAQNPWRPGLDDLSTHLTLVEDWLRREFQSR